MPVDFHSLISKKYSRLDYSTSLLKTKVISITSLATSSSASDKSSLPFSLSSKPSPKSGTFKSWLNLMLIVPFLEILAIESSTGGIILISSIFYFFFFFVLSLNLAHIAATFAGSALFCHAAVAAPRACPPESDS